MTDALKKSNTGLKRRPFLTPIWLAGISAALVVGVSGWLWSTADSTTVLVVPGVAPETGEARAGALARLLGDSAGPGSIGYIYSAAGAAGRGTVAVLSARRGLGVTDVPAGAMQDLAHRVLREHAGERVLIVADAASIPALLDHLGARGAVTAVGPQERDTLYVITVPRIGHANLLRLNF